MRILMTEKQICIDRYRMNYFRRILFNLLFSVSKRRKITIFEYIAFQTKMLHFDGIKRKRVDGIVI